MQLIDKLRYLRLMNEGPCDVFTPSSAAIDRVLKYATDEFPKLELKQRKLKATDIAGAFRHGKHAFYHVKAFPRRLAETFVIVVASEDEEFRGHILIDLAAEYSQSYLDCPSLGFADHPVASDIERLIPQIHPDDDNPFAILSVGEGTYMQTLRTDEGYILEHQLVNTSSHYEIPQVASTDQAVSAMIAYAFGKNDEWLEAFPWQLQQLK